MADRYDPVDRWVWHPVSLVRSDGPSQSREASDSDPAYEPPKQRLGFAPPAPEPVDEPLVWEGE